ncbi:MAG TPA: F0F1 ATP synthase subunit A [Tepidisphaeraceae bacterium]|nr:F0F1 ATP synthase subunit A [Tepidisphaeraceae bacterium]
MLPFLAAAADPTAHVRPQYLFTLGDPYNPWFIFTNQMLMALVAGLLMIWLFPKLFDKARSDAPTGARNFFEAILEFLRVEVVRPALKEHTDRFIPFLWTVFFFILFSNLLGQIPLDEILLVISGGYVNTHIAGTATGTLLATGALAIVCFFFIHANGIRQVAHSLMAGTYGHHENHEEHSSHEAAHNIEHGRGHSLPADVPADFRALGNPTKHYAADQHVIHNHSRPDDGHLHDGGVVVRHADKVPANVAWISAFPLYLWNFAPHPFKPEPGESKAKWAMDVPMWAFLLLLELLGALIKPFALTVRLFANMIAGHIVLSALIILIPPITNIGAHIAIGVPVTALSLGIRILEVFVAFLQAYIFTFLTTLFIASAVAPEH